MGTDSQNVRKYSKIKLVFRQGLQNLLCLAGRLNLALHRENKLK